MSSLIVEVATIDAVYPHPDADRLDVVQVKGWFCVTSKGLYKVGDKCVYIPIDSVLGEPTLSALFPPESKVRPNNGRIKTIKIRGVVSQGLVASLSALGLPPDLAVGTDVAAQLNIVKYEPPAEHSVNYGSQSAPISKDKINPNFQKYTDIENYKNYHKVFEPGEEVCITEKIHGTNFRCGWVPKASTSWWERLKRRLGLPAGYEFVYGSRNLQLTDKLIRGRSSAEVNNVYAKIVIQYQLKKLLKPGEVLYGEIYGDGLQRNYTYGCKKGEHKLVVFDLMRDGRYCPPAQTMGWCNIVGLQYVPILFWGPFSAETAYRLTEGASFLCGSQKVREGIVIRPTVECSHPRIGRKVLKLISDQFLLDKHNTDHH